MIYVIRLVDFDNLKMMIYEVIGWIVWIIFNWLEKGNVIIVDILLELFVLVECVDLDLGVYVILVFGCGEGFCVGFDLFVYVEGLLLIGGGGVY